MFDDARWNDSRDRNDDSLELGRAGRDPLDVRDREQVDPRDVFANDLDLPRGHERELVWDRDHHYSLRGSESRTLATVGAFRVVSARDLRDYNDLTLDPRQGDLRHLREEGLVRTVPLDGHKDVAVA